MRMLFIMLLVCVLMSLLAIFGVSAITLIPQPHAEIFRFWMMIVAGIFFVGWSALAFWAWLRWHAAQQPLPPQWFRRLLIFASVVYLFGVFIFVLG